MVRMCMYRWSVLMTGTNTDRVLDSKPVSAINAQLTAGSKLYDARKLDQNAGLGFIGVAQKAPFDIDDGLARQFLLEAESSRPPEQ